MTRDNISENFNNSDPASSKKDAIMDGMLFEDTSIKLNEINYIDLKSDYGSDDMIIAATAFVNDLEDRSLHPKYKVGAMIVGKTKSGKIFIVPAVNQVPKKLDKTFPIEDTKAYGGGSASEHAEMAALTAMLDLDEEIESYHVFTSKTCCPSCAKMLSIFDNADEKQPKMCGLYTDGKSLSGAYDEGQINPADFWKLARRMLKPVLNAGNIGLYLVNLSEKGKKIKLKIGEEKDKIVKTENNLKIKNTLKKDINAFDDKAQIYKAGKLSLKSKLEDKHAAIAFGYDQYGNVIRIKATDSLSPGLVYEKDANKINEIEYFVREEKGKKSYTLRVSPLENILGNALRHRIVIKKLYSTEIPPSGVMLNAISAGLEKIITPPIHLNVLQNEDHKAFADLILSGAIECGTAKVPPSYALEWQKTNDERDVTLN